MKEKLSFLIWGLLLVLLLCPNFVLADDPGNPDTCRVGCPGVTLPEQQVVVEVTVYNDEDLGGLAVPLVFGYPSLDVVCDSVSFVGTRAEYAEYQGASIDTTNYKLVFYAVFIDSDLTSGDGVVANLYFTTGPNWDSTLCVEIDTTFYPPTTVLEFSPRASGQALYPEFKKGCVGSGPTPLTELISPENQANLCSPDTFDFVWSKAGENLVYTLQYAQDSNFTLGVVTIPDLTDTTYTASLPRQTYFWHVKTTNQCGKDSPYQDQPFGFYVFLSGDATNDGVVDLGDVVFVINYVYREGTAPDPFGSGDASCDGLIDLSDVVWLISYVYRDGPPPCCP